MEIPLKVKIFPDPVFCGGPIDGEHQECQFLVYNEDCGLFTDENGLIELNLKVSALGEEIATKCPECKEAYQKQLEKDKLTIPMMVEIKPPACLSQNNTKITGIFCIIELDYLHLKNKKAMATIKRVMRGELDGPLGECFTMSYELVCERFKRI